MTSDPLKPASKNSGFRRLLPHLAPARWTFVGGLLAGALYAASSATGIPVVAKVVLPVFFDREQEASPLVVATARRLFGEAYQEQLLIVACLGLPLIFVLRGLGAFLNRYLVNKAGYVLLDGLQRELFAKLQALPLSFYQRHKAGDLVTRVMQDTSQLRNVLVNVGSDIVRQPLMLVFALGTLAWLSIGNRSAMFALIALLSVPLCVLPIRFAAKKLIRRARVVTQRQGELSAFVVEAVQSPQEIQAYNLQDTLQERFAGRIREIFRLLLKTNKYQSIVSPIIEVISACGFVAALYFGVRQGMDYGTFTALAITLYMAYEPVKKLSTIHGQLKVGAASLERISAILDAEDTVPQPAAPVVLPAGALELNFDNVGFSYAATEENPDAVSALAGVSLTIRPGETVALVGASGAGKSTFISLVPRFYDPTSGRVTLGGIDLRDADKTALRDRIALVPQTPALFNTTLAENIRVGRPGATDEQIRTAARSAHIADFIESLPEGYATMVGERGTTLSGGQRQRIALARAFLKDAPILILDEATSALDSESEAQIQLALDQLVRGRTTFMIAHRFSSIRSATRILVFDAGHIIADGAHADLYETSPHYRELYDRQSLGNDRA
ncbi:MAG: ABC transporter ATP-binding protein [Verrucomicrobiota bacterium]